jgi:alkanesulfonate monooxygenase SsuD/methylene tetrahydromethanopterin reductase-like flavin-dependent oxidoreductase (luciferase family)
MRVCLMIEGQEGVTWDQWRALAETAEASGFEALLRSDHYESLGGFGGGGKSAQS